MLNSPRRNVHGVIEQLTEAFKRLVPLQPVRPKGGKPTIDALTKASSKALAEFYKVAQVEREQNRLGIIGRARVAFGLQQRLLAAGYPSPLVKQVLFAMLTSAFIGEQK